MSAACIGVKKHSLRPELGLTDPRGWSRGMDSSDITESPSLFISPSSYVIRFYLDIRFHTSSSSSIHAQAASPAGRVTSTANPIYTASIPQHSLSQKNSAKMAQRVTLRKRTPYNTTSNRRRVVKTPGGKLVVHHIAKLAVSR